MSRDVPPTEITKVGQDFSYLAEFTGEADTSIAAMAEHRVLSRLKTLQAQSDQTLVQAHGIGALVIMPARVRVITPQQRVKIVPLAFFEEFVTWRDRMDKSGPSIVARSMQANSPLALKCRDATKRDEIYPGGTKDKPWKYRHTEHLNFASVIFSPDHPQFMVPVVLSFFRGEFSIGRQFISNIMLRRINGRQAPLWSTVWDLSIGQRTNQHGTWHGVDVHNPSDGQAPFIGQEYVEKFRAESTTLYEQIAKQMISVDMNDVDDDREPTEGTSTVPPKDSPF